MTQKNPGPEKWPRKIQADTHKQKCYCEDFVGLTTSGLDKIHTILKDRNYFQEKYSFILQSVPMLVAGR